MAPIGRAQTREYSEREQAALQTWFDLLKAGEASVNLEDRIDAVRFGKVSLPTTSIYNGCPRLSLDRSPQNIWNCSWSSIQGLIRGTPDSFVDFPAEDLLPLKAFMREVVDTGFKAGLLHEGDIQYPAGDKVQSAEKTAEAAWERVSHCHYEWPSG